MGSADWWKGMEVGWRHEWSNGNYYENNGRALVESPRGMGERWTLSIKTFPSRRSVLAIHSVDVNLIPNHACFV